MLFDGNWYGLYYPDNGCHKSVNISGMDKLMAQSKRLKKKNTKVATRANLVVLNKPGWPVAASVPAAAAMRKSVSFEVSLKGPTKNDGAKEDSLTEKGFLGGTAVAATSEASTDGDGGLACSANTGGGACLKSPLLTNISPKLLFLWTKCKALCTSHLKGHPNETEVLHTLHHLVESDPLLPAKCGFISTIQIMEEMQDLTTHQNEDVSDVALSLVEKWNHPLSMVDQDTI